MEGRRPLHPSTSFEICAHAKALIQEGRWTGKSSDAMRTMTEAALAADRGIRIEAEMVTRRGQGLATDPEQALRLEEAAHTVAALAAGAWRERDILTPGIEPYMFTEPKRFDTEVRYLIDRGQFQSQYHIQGRSPLLEDVGETLMNNAIRQRPEPIRAKGPSTPDLTGAAIAHREAGNGR